VVKTVPVPDKPEFAVDDGQGQIFVNIESEPGQMLVIDSQKLTIKAVWPMRGCNSPSGLALDGVHHRLFSVCDGRVMAVTNSTDGTQVALVPIGEHPDAAAYDVKRGLVYSSNGDGTLSVIHQDSADHYAALDTVTTQRGARTMALDAGSGTLYLVTADFGPPPPATVSQPYPRPTPIADSFVLLVVGKP
jgi:DNA-binding beta-propeller fold protein YncE